MQFKNILCVCTGNICRSPIAEAYLARHLGGVNVASAGTHAVVGHSADETASQIAAEHGLDLSSHVARQIDNDVLRQQDLILVMEQGHLNWIRGNFPSVHGATFLVSRWSDGNDVDDPFRQSKNYFDTIFARLKPCLDDWVKKLQPAARNA